MTANSDPQERVPDGPGINAGPAPADPDAFQPPQAPDAAQPTAPHIPQPVPATVRRTRLGGLWLVFTLGAVLLVLLLVFILMNGQRVEIHVYGGHWNAPVGVALLMAAALGVLLVVVPGGGRIIQLKRAARRLHKQRERLATQLDDQSVEVSPPPTAQTR
jgi:uncharacterized integral membrane protein